MRIPTEEGRASNIVHVTLNKLCSMQRRDSPRKSLTSHGEVIIHAGEVESERDLGILFLRSEKSLPEPSCKDYK